MHPVREAREFFEVAMAPVLQACTRRDESPSAAAGPTSIEALHAAADSLYVEVSKAAVLLGGGSKASEGEARSVLEAAKQRFAAVCALLYGRVAGAAGPSLRSATAAAARGLLQACQAFLDSLDRPAEAEQVPQKVGIVRERCTAIMRAPRDNRAAVGAQLTKIARHVKDALREAHELVQPAASHGDETATADMGHQANGHASVHISQTADQQDAAVQHSSRYTNSSDDAVASSTTHGISDAADMLAFEGDLPLEELSANEVAIAQAAEKVVRQVLDMLLALIRALSKMEEPTGPELETWESLVFHCRTLQTSANDLVADLFGPQDPESVASAASAVLTGSELIFEELPADLPENHSKPLAIVREGLSSAGESLQARLDEALQHRNAELGAEE